MISSMALLEGVQISILLAAPVWISIWTIPTMVWVLPVPGGP